MERDRKRGMKWYGQIKKQTESERYNVRRMGEETDRDRRQVLQIEGERERKNPEPDNSRVTGAKKQLMVHAAVVAGRPSPRVPVT